MSARPATIGRAVAAMAARGIPSNGLSSGSCTATRPPRLSTCAHPRAPSSSVPLRTTARVRGPAQQVEIGRGHVHVPVPQRLAVLCGGGLQRSRPVEDARESAARPRRDVQDDQDGRPQIAGQAAEQRPQGLDSAGRGGHHDDVPRGKEA
nr:hypothetical protein [Microbispora sp. H10885]